MKENRKGRKKKNVQGKTSRRSFGPSTGDKQTGKEKKKIWESGVGVRLLYEKGETARKEEEGGLSREGRH